MNEFTLKIQLYNVGSGRGCYFVEHGSIYFSVQRQIHKKIYTGGVNKTTVMSDDNTLANRKISSPRRRQSETISPRLLFMC